MSEKTLIEIRRAGLEALVEKLGLIGMIKFLQQYDKGSGDYTKERQQWKYKISHDQIKKELSQKEE